MNKIEIEYWVPGQPLPLVEIVEGDERTYGEIVEELLNDVNGGHTRVFEVTGADGERMTRIIPPQQVHWLNVVQDPT